jgi:hypothetical protein
MLDDFNLVAIFMMLIGATATLVSVFVLTRRDDEKSVMQKQMLRWEGPALFTAGLALNFYDFETIMFPILGLFFVSASVGIWQGARELKTRKNNGGRL